MGTLYAQLRNERKKGKPPCLWRSGCKSRKCPKKCADYIPDLRK